MAMASFDPLSEPTTSGGGTGVHMIWVGSHKEGWCGNFIPILSAAHLARAGAHMNNYILWVNDSITKTIHEQTAILQNTTTSEAETAALSKKEGVMAKMHMEHLNNVAQKRIFTSLYECPNPMGYLHSMGVIQRDITRAMMSAEDKLVGEGWPGTPTEQIGLFAGFAMQAKNDLIFFPENKTFSEKGFAAFNAWKFLMLDRMGFIITKEMKGQDAHVYEINRARGRELRVILSEAMNNFALDKAPIIPAEGILKWMGPYLSRPTISVTIADMPVQGTTVGAPQENRVNLIKQNAELYAMIVEAAQKNGVDPDLFAALVAQESGGVANAVSSAGAAGLTQLMKGTARDLGLTVNDTVDERFDPVKNLNAGARYLAQMTRMFNGDVVAALTSYNWGPGNVQCYLKFGHGMAFLQSESGKKYRKCIAEKGPSIPAEAYKYPLGIIGVPAIAMGGGDGTSSGSGGGSSVNSSKHVITTAEIEKWAEDVPGIQDGDMISISLLLDLIGKRFSSETYLAHVDALDASGVMKERMKLNVWKRIVLEDIHKEMRTYAMLRSVQTFGVYNKAEESL